MRIFGGVLAVVAACALVPVACTSSTNSNDKPGDKSGGPNAPTNLTKGHFACGDTQCRLNAEYCVEQRFTAGGAVAKATCHTLTMVEGKDQCDSALETVPSELREEGSFCTSTLTEGVTISYVTPDLLPLEDKLTDRLTSGSLAITLVDQTLVNRINNATYASQAPYVEAGRISSDSDVKSMWCRIKANDGGFAQTRIPYDLTSAKTDDRMVSNLRWLRFSTNDPSGRFSIFADCTRQNDTTPFTVKDLRTIFGSLATFE